MSLRHALANSSAPKTPISAPLGWNKRHLFSAQIAKELAGRAYAELRIGRFDAQEKLINGSPFERLDVENGVVRLWQTIHCEHADERS
jgi:hypothetical protein